MRITGFIVGQLLCSVAGSATAGGLDVQLIDRLTNAKGAFDAKEGVYKVAVARTDLKVSVAGIHVIPAMGLGSWAAFRRVETQTMVMGDLCLTAGQVNAVLSEALDNGLEVTALHNHFLWDAPRVMFMHIGGMGDEAALARAVGKVFAAIKATSEKKEDLPDADVDTAAGGIDPKKIDAILDRPGSLSAGVYKIVVRRTTRMHGATVGQAMGVNTWAAFAGTDRRAVVDGDFAMLGPEVQAVLKSLRRSGIYVVAIHNHMIDEQPRIVFLHFWGVGPVEDLARGFKAALAAEGSAER